MMHIQKNIK